MPNLMLMSHSAKTTKKGREEHQQPKYPTSKT